MALEEHFQMAACTHTTPSYFDWCAQAGNQRHHSTPYTFRRKPGFPLPQTNTWMVFILHSNYFLDKTEIIKQNFYSFKTKKNDFEQGIISKVNTWKKILKFNNRIKKPSQVSQCIYKVMTELWQKRNKIYSN